MNFFRVPLNLIVVLMLSQDLAVSTIFKCCVLMLALAAAFQHWLYGYACAASESKGAGNGSPQRKLQPHHDE